MESRTDKLQEPKQEIIETIFHFVEEGSAFVIESGFFKSLAKRNFLIINEDSYDGSHASFKETQIDDIFINRSENYQLDPEGVDAFVDKYMTNPKTTRLIYWSDGDIKTVARLTEKHGTMGESASDALLLLDKYRTKELLIQAGVKCAEYYHYSQVKEEDIDRLVGEIEVKHNREYPLFGKPTTLNQSRGTAIIKNREELVDYLKYSMTHPELEFMIETYLEGIHGAYGVVIMDGKIVYDSVDYYPNELRETNFGKPAAIVRVPYESEMYRKSVEAMEKLLHVLPHCQNTIFWYEFVYMKGPSISSKHPSVPPHFIQD